MKMPKRKMSSNVAIGTLTNFLQGGNEDTVDAKEVQIGKRIGKGSFAEVFEGKWQGMKVAIKRGLRFDKGHEKSFLNEIHIHSKLRHPNVVQFIGACKTTEGLVLVVEFMEKVRKEIVSPACHFFSPFVC